MKKFLFLILMVLSVHSLAFAQGVLRQDGIIYTLYAPEGKSPYAEVSANFLTKETDVVIPASVTKDGVEYIVTTIGQSAFYQYQSLTSIKLPNTITEIGWEAFYECYFLSSINIPNSVNTISGAAFVACGFTSIEIPNSVTKIGSSAFSRCAELTSIEIPNSVTEIEKEAFQYCTGLISIKLSNNLTKIKFGTFEYCSNLTSIEIPNSVTEIEDNAFGSCHSLTSIKIPSSVIAIGRHAFEGCKVLSLIEILNSEISLGWEAFLGCFNIRTIYYHTANPEEYSKNLFPNAVYNNATLYVEKGGLEKAYVTSPWMYFVNINEVDFSGIEYVLVDIDSSAPVQIYNLNGVKVADTMDNIPAGIYIIRQGNKSKKIIVK